MRLLVADDQNSVHLFLDKMLSVEKLGITEVLHARDGEQAADMAEKYQPELILLDIRMPVMDGMEVLERLKQKKFQCKIIILSAYNEFEYARQCMGYGVKDYLLKPIDIEELENTLIRLMEEIRSEYAHRLCSLEFGFLAGKWKTEKWEEEAEKILQVLLKPEDSFYAVCSRAGETLQINGRNDSVSTAATEELQIFLCRCKSQNEWMQDVEFLRNHTSCPVGVSTMFHERKRLPAALVEAREALTQGFYNMGVNIYRPGAFVYPGQQPEGALADRLTDAIQKGNVQEIKVSLEKLFAGFQINSVHPQYVCEFCYSYLIGMNKNFVETFQRLKGNDLTADFRYQDVVSLKNTFFRFILTIRSDVTPEKALSDTDTVKKIKRYIDENYEKDLSLAAVTKHFFISKYQVSRLFKKMFGKNYSEYVLEIRMRTAGHLLLNTREKVEEIARQVGFEDAAYFSRVFSKYFDGISPGEYRRRTAAEGKGEKNDESSL